MSTKFSKTGTYKGKETTSTTTGNPANGTGATAASEKRNCAEITKSRGCGGAATSKGGAHADTQERRGGNQDPMRLKEDKKTEEK
jgi:hypothetical protein